MCASRMVMQHWARKYNTILLHAGLGVPLLRGYVDDGRQGSTVLRRGMVFDIKRNVFIIKDPLPPAYNVYFVRELSMKMLLYLFFFMSHYG